MIIHFYAGKEIERRFLMIFYDLRLYVRRGESYFDHIMVKCMIG